MSDTTLQQVVNHQSLNFHLPCNVQIGEHNIQNHLTNQLKDDVEKMKNEIQQLKLDNLQLQLDKQSQADKIQSQAGEIQQLGSRVKVVENKTEVKKTDKNINKENDDLITLTVRWIDGKMTISVSRSKTVRELQPIVQKELRRKYGDGVCCITHIYSVKQKKDIYNNNNNNEDLPLSHYRVGDGDEVKWIYKFD